MTVTESKAGKGTFVNNLMDELRGTPGAAYAVAGLALSICANEVWRYPIAMDLSISSSPLYNLLIALTLFLFAALFSRQSVGVVQKPAFVGLVAVVATVSLYGYFMSGVLLVAQASRLIFSVAGIVLFICWMATLYKKSPTVAAALLIASLGLVFCFQAAVSLLSQAVIKGSCALFPCFSALFYLLFKGAESRSVAMGLQIADSPAEEPNATFGLKEMFGQNIGYTLLGLVVLFHGICFAQLHVMWLPVQDNWGAFTIQLASASGSLVAFVALLLVSPMPDRRMSLLVCESLLLVFSFFAMWLSTAAVGEFSFLYLTMLNAAQKVLIYLVFFASLPLAPHRLKLAAFCGLYGAFRMGTPVIRGVDAVLGGGEVALIANGIFMLVALAGATVVLIFVMANPNLLPPIAALRTKKDPSEQQEPGQGEPAETSTETEQYKKIAFYFLLGQKYNLTQREIELLPLLSQRQSARSIADELSISQATAKTHIRNIYAKLDVHTQDDLVDVIERDRTSLFEQLPSWYLKN